MAREKAKGGVSNNLGRTWETGPRGFYLERKRKVIS